MSQIVSHRPTDSHCGEPVCRPTRAHWRRLVKILGGQTKILWSQKMVKSNKCMCASQLLGARAQAAPSPKSTSMPVH